MAAVATTRAAGLMAGARAGKVQVAAAVGAGAGTVESMAMEKEAAKVAWEALVEVGQAGAAREEGENNQGEVWAEEGVGEIAAERGKVVEVAVQAMAEVTAVVATEVVVEKMGVRVGGMRAAAGTGAAAMAQAMAEETAVVASAVVVVGTMEARMAGIPAAAVSGAVAAAQAIVKETGVASGMGVVGKTEDELGSMLAAVATWSAGVENVLARSHLYPLRLAVWAMTPTAGVQGHLYPMPYPFHRQVRALASEATVRLRIRHHLWHVEEQAQLSAEGVRRRTRPHPLPQVMGVPPASCPHPFREVFQALVAVVPAVVVAQLSLMAPPVIRVDTQRCRI